jgi:ABC-type sugar transport system ATPase subunit
MVYVTHDQVEAMGMADRIAVMDRGVLQQYGSPDDLYNRPANTFVAGFVGSTRINFLDVGLLGAQAPAGTTQVAIRPEYVRLVSPDAGDATLRGNVTLIEPLGAKDVVHVAVERESVRVVGVPGARPRIGEPVGLALPPQHRLHFDAAGMAVPG